MNNEYDPHDDLNKSINECYRAIRERQAAGGPGFDPERKPPEICPPSAGEQQQRRNAMIADAPTGFQPAPPPGTVQLNEPPARKKRRASKKKPAIKATLATTFPPAKKKRRTRVRKVRAVKVHTPRVQKVDFATAIDVVAGLKEKETRLISSLIEQLAGVSKKSRARIVESLRRMYG